MPGSSPAGPIGTSGVSLTIDEGTMARANSPAPGTVGADASAAERRSAASVAVASAGADPAIEALNLRGAARAAAYALRTCVCSRRSCSITSANRESRR